MRDGFHRHRHCGEGEGCPRATTRVQLELPPQALERLQRLKEQSEAASYAEVIRSALRLYEMLMEEQAKGSELTFRRPDGQTVACKVF